MNGDGCRSRGRLNTLLIGWTTLIIIIVFKKGVKTEMTTDRGAW